MNLAFVGYEELSRSRRVLSAEAEVNNTLRDPNTLIVYYPFKIIPILKT